VNWFTRFAIEAIFPSTEALPGVAETDLGPFLKDVRANAPPLMRIGLTAATFVFMISPILTVYLPVPAFVLRGRLLERHASRLLNHRSYVLRQIVYLLKMVGGLCWGEHAEARRRLGRPALPPDPRTWQGMDP
jgi:hypothetical protein